VTRPQVGAEEASVAPEAGARQERSKERTPPGDWAGLPRRTFRRERHPRAHGVEAHAATAQRPDAPAAPLMGARPGQACPRRLRGLSTGPALSSAGSRQRPSSAPRLLPSPSTRPLSCLDARIRKDSVRGIHAGLLTTSQGDGVDRPGRLGPGRHPRPSATHDGSLIQVPGFGREHLRPNRRDTSSRSSPATASAPQQGAHSAAPPRDFGRGKH